jgi:hypothetical protein
VKRSPKVTDKLESQEAGGLGQTDNEKQGPGCDPGNFKQSFNIPRIHFLSNEEGTMNSVSVSQLP